MTPEPFSEAGATVAHSTATSRRKKGEKPSKPRPDFPLTPHPAGQWCKKIRGKLYYFGPWGDPQSALNRYLDIRDDLQAGRDPQPDGCVLRDLCNQFLTVKQSLVNTGELTKRSWDDYKATCERLIRLFGLTASVESLRPQDFVGLKEDIAATRKSLASMAGETVVNLVSVGKYSLQKRGFLMPRKPEPRQKVSPPVLAERWGLACEKIVAFIRSGELRAINVASRGSTRPRSLIDEKDIRAFKQQRRVATSKRRHGDAIREFRRVLQRRHRHVHATAS
jgi:hypothetical protein